MTEIDFQGLAQALLCRVNQLLPVWLPGGKLVRNEYHCASILGEVGDSFKVNISSGKWADFATNHRGGDLISLYATINNIGQLEAAKRLQDFVGLRQITKKQSPILPASDRLIPPPAGAPVPHDTNSKCEAWIGFLNHVFSDDQNLVLTAQKIFGYILMSGEPFLHKAFVLYGTGRNGKSTFLSVLKKLLGPTNYAVVSLQSLDRPFSAVALDGALANILEETPNDKINSHAFKAAVGGGELNMARKYYDEYVGKVSARFIFACNEMPIFHDNTTALVDRLFFLPFTRYIPEVERDTQIEERLHKELPGILNWAIEGMKLVFVDRHIEPPVASLSLLEKYRIESDPLYSWVHNKIEFGNNYAGESTSELYDQYRQDMQKSGFVVKNEQVFYKNFKRIATQLAHRSAATEFKYDRIIKLGRRVRGFTAIHLKRDGDFE